MGRPEGSRNAGYARERARLARRLLERLCEHDGPQASFRNLAAACGVSPPTLRHYFGNREGAIIAALEQAELDHAHHLSVLAEGDMGDLRESLHALIRYMILGWDRFGIGAMMRFGVEVGLGDTTLGPVCVERLMAPVLDAFTVRLERHIACGELRVDAPREAAFSLITPIFAALMYQRELSGEVCQSMDLHAYADFHIDAFLRAFGTTQTDTELAGRANRDAAEIAEAGCC